MLGNNVHGNTGFNANKHSASLALSPSLQLLRASFIHLHLPIMITQSGFECATDGASASCTDSRVTQTIIFANNGLSSLCGYSIDCLQDKDLQWLIADDITIEALQQLYQSLQQHKPFLMSIEVHRNKAQSFHAELQACPIIESEKVYWLWLVKDLSSSAQDLHRLQEQQACWRLAIESAGIEAWDCDSVDAPTHSRHCYGNVKRILDASMSGSVNRQAETCWLNSEEQHKNLMDNLQSGVVVHAPDTSILFSNVNAENLSAYTLAHIQSPNSPSAEWYFIGEDRERLAVDQYPVNRVIKTFEPIIDCLVGVCQHDATAITWLMLSSYPEFSNNNELSHIVVTFVDMTAQVLAEEQLRISEERFQLAAKGASFGVWDWNILTEEVYFSERCKEMLGYREHEFDNSLSEFLKIIHDDDLECFHKALQAHLQGYKTAYEVELRLKHANGDYHWFYARGEVIRDDRGTAYRMAGSVADISDRRKVQKELELAAMVYEHSSEAMMVNDANHHVIAINPAFTEITGYSAEEVIGTDSRFYISDSHNPQQSDDMNEAIESAGFWQGEIWSKRKNGDDIAESIAINAIYHRDGSIHRYVVLFSDITEKRKSEELIWYQANYDTLTELPNRNMFRDRMIQEISKGRRESNPFALLFIDLDHFKEVNDTLGHLIGDILLIEAARRIKNCVRETDTVARQGGDEFCVMLVGMKAQAKIERVVQNIIHSLAKQFTLNGENVHISASVGITLYPDDAESIEHLFKFADQAMYEAKKSGRNRYSYFTQSLQQSADKRMLLTKELRDAITSEQFEIFYQPIVDLRSGYTHKAEALVRWRHPERGIVSPDEFIPLAEDTGLIVDLGDWIFKQAARQAKTWRNSIDADFQISVNKSPVQFIDEDLSRHRQWLHYLQDIDLCGDAIVIEITEGILLDTPAVVMEKMQSFHKAGVSISLDDFGTGYSSLSYLKKFDIDVIKIDRAFVHCLEHDKDDQALCEAIIVMAHKLGLKVVAEGIENEAQCKMLQQADCDYGQGYLFSKAIPADKFTEYLIDNEQHGNGLKG